MTYNFKQEGVAYYLQVRIFLQKSMVAVYSFISEPGLVLLARYIQLEEAKYLARRRHQTDKKLAGGLCGPATN